MSTPQTVSNTAAQHSSATPAAFTGAGAGSSLSGNAFEQALFSFLQSNSAASDGLDALVTGAGLPAGGENLPSVDQILQQLEQALTPEQLQDVFSLLQGEDVDTGGLPDELVSSVQTLLQGVESGEISRNQAQQLKEWLADTLGITEQTNQSKPAASDTTDVTRNTASGTGSLVSAVTEDGRRGVSESVEERAFAVSDERAREIASASAGQGNGGVESSAETTTNDSESVARDSVVETLDRASQSTKEAVNSAVLASSQANVTEQQRAATTAAMIDAKGEVKATASSSVADAVVSSANSTSTQQQSGQGAGSQDQPSQAQQFRELMASQRMDANAADSQRNVSFGNAFVLQGQANGSETSSRLNASLSGFQQLQQTYSGGDAGSQVALSVGAKFGTQAWTPNMSQRIAWMANQQVGHADIRLDPPDLGSLNIRLTVQNDQATVSFVSPNPQVRDALESQMPRLREMLEESGLQLADTDVSAESGGQEREQGEHASRGSGLKDLSNEDGVSGVPIPEGAVLSLVDYYA